MSPSILKNWEEHGLIEIHGSSWWYTQHGLESTSFETRAGLRRALRGQNVYALSIMAMEKDGFTKEGYFG